MSWGPGSPWAGPVSLWAGEWPGGVGRGGGERGGLGRQGAAGPRQRK